MTDIRRRTFVTGLLAVTATVTATGALADAPRPPRKRVPPPEVLLPRARLGDARLGWAVVDRTGALIEGRSAGDPMPPASTLKTVTALYALDRLGGDHRFVTRVLRSGDTLVLAGGGDPSLDSDRLAQLATEVAAAAGDWRPVRLAVWGGALPRVDQIAPGQAVQLAYNPTLSGMMLNHNRVRLGWRCAERCDLTMTATGTRQAPRAFGIDAALAPAWSHRADAGGESWGVPRSTLGRSGERWLPVRNPELYAGDVFQTLCRAAGLPIRAVEVAGAEPTGSLLAGSASLPLRDILRGMLKYSTNLTAEAVGLAASGAGDLPASAAAMRDWVAAQGVGGAEFADHSGLGASSRIAPLVLARLLAPSADVLRPLLNADPVGPVGLPVNAKTGTLNFVANLAGYATRPDGAELSFACMIGDEGRRQASEGAELPDGVIGWTDRARSLQAALLMGLGNEPPRPLPPEI
ncbi:D-alanyl-D-alanine carboxypeptidase [Paracoccus luteus]|uniref:D-alanyl-D-alanine carboxypeptidase n=1 Tax=Paracoccus luteus TaxID=2508543 RepID=UPI001FE8C783|nr:D-alanyl-D-alanine carboxypeptidase [Paracoccus luteus]